MQRPRRRSAPSLVALALVLTALSSPALSAAKKGMRLWNLTGETLNRVELAPAGTTAWGRNQCQNDKDGEVDFDEQLPVTGIPPGRYDIRVRDVKGRTCTALNVEVKADSVFAVHEKDLTGCVP